jgi:hypothetical protein
MHQNLKAYRDKFERMNLNEAEIRRKLQIIQDNQNMPIVAAAPAVTTSPYVAKGYVEEGYFGEK